MSRMSTQEERERERETERDRERERESNRTEKLRCFWEWRDGRDSMATYPNTWAGRPNASQAVQSFQNIVPVSKRLPAFVLKNPSSSLLGGVDLFIRHSFWIESARDDHKQLDRRKIIKLKANAAPNHPDVGNCNTDKSPSCSSQN